MYVVILTETETPYGRIKLKNSVAFDEGFLFVFGRTKGRKKRKDTVQFYNRTLVTNECRQDNCLLLGPYSFEGENLPHIIRFTIVLLEWHIVFINTVEKSKRCSLALLFGYSSAMCSTIRAVTKNTFFPKQIHLLF